MKVRNIFFILLLFFRFINLSYAQAYTVIKKSGSDPNQPAFKLFLVGDAGENNETGPTLNDLKLKLLESPNSAVIFLGDNCYKRTLFGLLKTEMKGFDGSRTTRNKMMSQLNILKNYKGSAYFVPGNHDWWNCISIKKGKKHVLKEELFIRDSINKFTGLLNYDEGAFFPKNGDAGPVSIEFNDQKVVIIFIDTYRLILEEIRNRKENKEYLDAFYKDLQEQLANAATKKQKIIVAAHHPIHSKGKHSQPIKFWHKHVKRFANSNLNYRPNKMIATKIDSLLKLYNNTPVYYVCGHEHSLEYLFENNISYIVSGAGSKIDKVDLKSVETKNEFLKWNEEGFFEIDFFGEHQKVIVYYRDKTGSELKSNCLEGCSD